MKTHVTHPPDSATPPTRILIVRLSAHGDVMHTLPMLAAIKRQNPDTRIGWLVERSAASLLEGHPWIDRLHVSDRKRWLALARNPLNWLRIGKEVRLLLREIREARYQVSLDPQGLLKSAMWPVLAGIPIRLGFRATRECADLFYTRRLPPMHIRDPHTPAVERYLDLTRSIGYLTENGMEKPRAVPPPISADSRRKVREWLSTLPPERPLIVLAPFTRWPSKHWETGYWSDLTRHLLEMNVNIAILGAPTERDAVEAMLRPLAGENRILNLAGQTDWPDLYALFEKTRLLIGLDSAPLHIADAVGVPEIIGLYGPTAPGRTGPSGKKNTILSTALACQPCFERHCPLKTHACMKQLTPDVVIAMTRRTLAHHPAETPR